MNISPFVIIFGAAAIVAAVVLPVRSQRPSGE
jgi:hypothetical protein